MYTTSLRHSTPPFASALWKSGWGRDPSSLVTLVTSRKKSVPFWMVLKQFQRGQQRTNGVFLDLRSANSGRAFCEPGKDRPNEACTGLTGYSSASNCGLCSEPRPAANGVERCLPHVMCAKSGHSLHGDLQQGVR